MIHSWQCSLYFLGLAKYLWLSAFWKIRFFWGLATTLPIFLCLCAGCSFLSLVVTVFDFWVSSFALFWSCFVVDFLGRFSAMEISHEYRQSSRSSTTQAESQVKFLPLISLRSIRKTIIKISAARHFDSSNTLYYNSYGIRFIHCTYLYFALIILLLKLK